MESPAGMARPLPASGEESEGPSVELSNAYTHTKEYKIQRQPICPIGRARKISQNDKPIILAIMGIQVKAYIYINISIYTYRNFWSQRS